MKKSKPVPPRADPVARYVPTNSAVAEFTEKRSRFIGHVWRIHTEEEARRRIEEVKAKHHDARHNCWCYLLEAGGLLRYSDDGEPQGTAGQPMLEVFRRANVDQVCCVVTRYFGGILLGTGGLARAYVKAASDALEASGLSVVRQVTEVAVACPYSLLERVKLETEALGGTLGQVDYAAEVHTHALLPKEQLEAFSIRISDLTAGKAPVIVLGQVNVETPCTENVNKV